jgi:outer membrane protein W
MSHGSKTTKTHASRFFISLLLALVGVSAGVAEAGFWETSLGVNYNRSEYSGGSYSRTKRFGGSLGYNFNDSSTIEYAYQQSSEHNYFVGFEDTKYVDKSQSINLVWNLLTRESVIQPYFKVGAGFLDREMTTTDYLGRRQKQTLGQWTGVAGIGLRIRLSRAFGLRADVTSYIPKARIKEWKNNLGATFGGSIYF